MIGKNFTIIDLTHTISSYTPTWKGNCGFEHKMVRDHKDCSTKTKFRNHFIQMEAGIGTHMDAPVHCIAGGKSIAELSLEELICPCVVIDVSEKVTESYKFSPKDILDFEENHGKIQPGSFAIIYTGWERFWFDPEKYRNNYVFPSITKEAASLLLERDIGGIGIDTLSPDLPEDDYPVHQLILAAGKYIVENVANASKMPPTGAYSFALPIKIEEGSEAPVRLIGMLLKE
jgi:kynurenine formamidase